MNVKKISISFALGIFLGYFFSPKTDCSDFHHHEIEPPSSRTDGVNNDLMLLKSDLSSCDKRALETANELRKVKEELSQLLSSTSKEVKAGGDDGSYEHTDTVIAPISRPREMQGDDKGENEKIDAEKWRENEKENAALVEDDAKSIAAFLKNVAITDFDKVLNAAEKIDQKNKNFRALQGLFRGVIRNLREKGKNYTLELELDFPLQGEGHFLAKIEGNGLKGTTSGRGEPSGFSSLKGLGSRAVFLKLDDNLYLQLYATKQSASIVGNAYRKVDKRFVKFGEVNIAKL